MTLNTMEDLLVHELRDLLSAEKQLVKALPKIAKAASNAALSQAITDHLRETEGHVDRLEECLELLDVAPRGKKCKGMEGLIAEGDDSAKEPDNDDVRDAAIIGAAQRVEHYEIAAYGTARAFALRLGFAEVAELLSKSLEEEAAANEKLTAIAEREVNVDANGTGNGHALKSWKKGGKDREGRKARRATGASSLQ